MSLPVSSAKNLAKVSSNFCKASRDEKVYLVPAKSKSGSNKFRVSSELIEKESNLGYKTLKAMRETLSDESERRALSKKDKANILQAAKEIRNGYERKYTNTGAKFVDGLSVMFGKKSKREKVEQEYRSIKRRLGKSSNKPELRELGLKERVALDAMVRSPEVVREVFTSLHAQLDNAQSRSDIDQLKENIKELKHLAKSRPLGKTDRVIDGFRIMFSGKKTDDVFREEYKKLKGAAAEKSAELKKDEDLGDAAEYHLDKFGKQAEAYAGDLQEAYEEGGFKGAGRKIVSDIVGLFSKAVEEESSSESSVEETRKPRRGRQPQEESEVRERDAERKEAMRKKHNKIRQKHGLKPKPS